ncbi:MAG: tetratricopeptide repeat protein, partial [Acidobacteria bacterium]|nr:tetratricopeptide repeat protein [Acidobacteriota bacterium]
LILILLFGLGCCLDLGDKEKKFKKRVLCAHRVNNENSLYILKNGAFCCPKLPSEVNDLTSARAFYLKKALEIDPERVDGWASLGQTYWDGWKFNEAIDSFKKALELSPNSVSFIIALNSLCRITKKFDESQKYLDLLKKSDFQDKEKTISYLEGKLLYERKDYDGALKSLERAKALLETESPSHFLSNSPYTINDIYFYLAQIYFKKNELQKAHNHFLIFLEKERHPDFVDIYQKSLQETAGEQALLYDDIEEKWAKTRQ